MSERNEMWKKRECLVIAPAGFGKTHMIADWTNRASTTGRQLILTHTHAGVASLKDKLKKFNLPGNNYSVETISGFAQKYVLAFCTDEIPSQSDQHYFPFIIKQATKICGLGPVQTVLLNSYNGLFVDEYQDCTLAQHAFVTVLSRCFPTRYLAIPFKQFLTSTDRSW